MKRRNLIIAAAVIIAVALLILVGIPFLRDTSITAAVTGVPTNISLRDQLMTKTAAAHSYNTDNGLEMISYVIPAQNRLQQQALYTSCTVQRGSTATPTITGATAPTAAATLVAASTTAATAASTAAAAGTQQAVDLSNLTFYKVAGDESEACYQVGEILFNQNNEFNLAVGVTKSIDAEVGIDLTNVANSQIGDITVNISEFKSDETRRDNYIHTHFLESNKYPYAKLTNAKVVGLPTTAYKEGDMLHFQIMGTLEVHATQHPVTFDATASLTGDNLVVTATTNLLMTDFGITPPDLGPMLKANNQTKIILNLVAHKTAN